MFVAPLCGKPLGQTAMRRVIRILQIADDPLALGRADALLPTENLPCQSAIARFDAHSACAHQERDARQGQKATDQDGDDGTYQRFQRPKHDPQCVISRVRHSAIPLYRSARRAVRGRLDVTRAINASTRRGGANRWPAERLPSTPQGAMTSPRMHLPTRTGNCLCKTGRPC